MIIIDRVEKFINKLPNKIVWDSLSSTQRSSLILQYLDEDTMEYQNEFVYNIFVKSHQFLYVPPPSSFIELNISYEELMSVLNHMRRFSRNWIFS